MECFVYNVSHMSFAIYFCTEIKSFLRLTLNGVDDSVERALFDSQLLAGFLKKHTYVYLFNSMAWNVFSLVRHLVKKGEIKKGIK